MPQAAAHPEGRRLEQPEVVQIVAQPVPQSVAHPEGLRLEQLEGLQPVAQTPMTPPM